MTMTSAVPPPYPFVFAANAFNFKTVAYCTAQLELSRKTQYK